MQNFLENGFALFSRRINNVLDVSRSSKRLCIVAKKDKTVREKLDSKGLKKPTEGP